MKDQIEVIKQIEEIKKQRPPRPRRSPIDPEWKVIGLNLRLRRTQYDLTQADLARALGLDPAYICRVEQGKAALSMKQLIKFRRVLGCSLFDLLKGV